MKKGGKLKCNKMSESRSKSYRGAKKATKGRATGLSFEKDKPYTGKKPKSMGF